MEFSAVEDLADAVLFEGYSLYPYYSLAPKNRQRWNFGTLYPQAFARAAAANDPYRHQAECLFHAASAAPALELRLRFLQPRDDSSGDAVRAVTLGPFPPAVLAAGRRQVAGGEWGLHLVVQVAATPLGSDVWRLRMALENRTPIALAANRDAALPLSLVSAQWLLAIAGGEFLSLLDPPQPWRAAAVACQNQSLFPVLAGPPGSDAGHAAFMLAAPIVLYDFPRVAAESPGAFFDNTEIDEMLALRITTLTDSEKEAMRADPRTRGLLRRVEQLDAEGWRRLHGRQEPG